MNSLSSFFAMGGHAGFIWPAYGIVALVLVGLIIASRRELHTRQQEIAALEAASPRRRAREKGGAS